MRQNKVRYQESQNKHLYFTHHLVTFVNTCQLIESVGVYCVNNITPVNTTQHTKLSRSDFIFLFQY